MLEGIINSDGTVLGEDGIKYLLGTRGSDDEGFPKVLIDARDVGGSGFMRGQSIKPYIGMKVEFYCVVKPHGYNYRIIEE
ncbi:hypothetical protein KAS08_03730 [Candidatus Pacearchaeota archaeon]|nr:hypothetical protein [Candidatus Pacearchaeota archaeon]